MQSKDELRKAIHQLIDSIEDEELLNQLMGDVVPYVIANRRRHPVDPGDESQKPNDVDTGNIDWDAYKIDPEDPGTKN